MLADLHAYLNILAPWPVLYILGRSAFFSKNCCMGMAGAVVIKLCKAQFMRRNLTDVLHVVANNIGPVQSYRDELHFRTVPDDVQSIIFNLGIERVKLIIKNCGNSSNHPFPGNTGSRSFLFGRGNAGGRRLAEAHHS